MFPAVHVFDRSHYSEARALWERTPGVGISEADQPHAVANFLQRNAGMSFVALYRGHVVGTILCGHDGRRGLIHHLVVAPEHRKNGLGRALLRSGLRALQVEGIDKCHLLVFQENESGLAFWRRIGAVERTELALFSLRTESAA